MAIKAWLEGQSVDLAILAEHFREGDPHVVGDDGGSYMTSAIFDDLLGELARLYNAASDLLIQMNGAARVLDTSFRPVSLVGRFEDENGSVHHVAIANAVEVRFHAHAVAEVVGQEPQDQPAPGPNLVRLGKTHLDLRDVLRILGQPSATLSWLDLRKAHEIVRANIGGRNDLLAKGWVSATDLDAFESSAAHPEISGDDAIHARRPKPASGRAMTLPEARDTISKLVSAWASSL